MNDLNNHLSPKNRPCFDDLTKKTYLSYSSRDDAIRACEDLWSTSSKSTSIKKCERCLKYHLLDALGFGLTSGEKLDLDEHKSGTTQSADLIRPKCSKCLSSDQKAKTIFKNYSDAQDYINSLPMRIDHGFAAYNCPHGNGIHLTKNTLLKRNQQIGLIYQEPPKVRDVPRLKDKLKVLTALAREKHLLEQAELVKIAELTPEAAGGYYRCPKCDHEWTFHDLHETYCKCGGKGPFKVRRS